MELVQEAHGLSDEDEVVVQGSTGDEGILVGAHEAAEPGPKTHREHLCKDLGDKMDQADGVIVADPLCVRCMLLHMLFDLTAVDVILMLPMFCLFL